MPENMATDSQPPCLPVDSIFSSSSLSQLCDDWDKTEEWVKDGESINRDTVASSINEMRYAGRRFVDALRSAQNGDTEEAKRRFSETRDDLIKARHDVIDSIVGYISEDANKYRDLVGAGNLHKHFPQYGELFSLLKKIQSQIVKSRKYREKRDMMYDEIMRDDLPKLREFYDTFVESKPAIEQNIQKDEKKERRTIMSLAFGGVIVIISLVKLLF